MSNNYYKNPEKSYGFGLRAFKKYPEIIPLCVIVSVAMLGSICYGFYSLTKLDVIVDRKKQLPPWERIDLENPKRQKFLTFNQKYDANPELIKLKKEM